MASSELQVKKIAIIGGGPSGVAVAKYLLFENAFTDIVIYEQRSEMGGIWNIDSKSPKADVDAFPSPVYDDMESNIPTEVMGYYSEPFPPDTPLLPGAETTLQYLQNYAKPVAHLVKLRHQVMDAFPFQESDQTKWRMKIWNLEEEKFLQEEYDAVVVANGRYNKPYIPYITGMDAWKKADPESLIHSKDYRDTRLFKNKKVLVVGFSSSGTDLVNQIKPVCKDPLLIAQRSKNGLSPGSQCLAEGKEFYPEPIELDVEQRSVIFANGKEERDIDLIVFCTGYEYEYPFLSRLPGFEGGNGGGNTSTYVHIFHIDFPSLAFALLPLRVVAFPFAETQAAVIARVWSGRLQLPSHEKRVEWVKERERLNGPGKEFHKLSFPADADYMNEMYQWCLSAQGETEKPHLRPPFWGQRDKWLRETIHQIRLATEARGDQRFAVTSAADVGFHFDRLQ